MSPKYEPFENVEEFNDLILSYYNYFCTSPLHSFPFEWVSSLGDVRTTCQDCTAEKVKFPISAVLQEAIENCDLINSPDASWLRSRSADSGWRGYIESAISKVGEQVKITPMKLFSGPIFDILRHGYYLRHHPVVQGSYMFEHQPDHWACIMLDHSAGFDERQGKGKAWLLRSELLASTAIFHGQMNTIAYKGDTDGYSVELKDRQGPLAATVVNFCRGRVRVVQATCNPADPLTTLNFKLMVDEALTTKDYKPKTAHKALKWILRPPGLKSEDPAGARSR